MQISQDIEMGRIGIKAYGPEGITLMVPRQASGPAEPLADDTGGRAPFRLQTFQCSLIITPERLIDAWPPQRYRELAAPHLETLRGLSVEILLLGTGEAMVRPDYALFADLINAGIGVEIMDTGAACRTYNLLMSDGRRVAAALFPA